MKQWSDTVANDLRKWVLFGKVQKAGVKQPVGLKWENRMASIKSVDYQINGVIWTMTSILIFTVFNGDWLCTLLMHMNAVLSFSTLSYFSLYFLSFNFSFFFSYASRAQCSYSLCLTFPVISHRINLHSALCASLTSPNAQMHD